MHAKITADALCTMSSILDRVRFPFTGDSASLVTPLSLGADRRHWHSAYKSPIGAIGDERVNQKILCTYSTKHVCLCDSSFDHRVYNGGCKWSHVLFYTSIDSSMLVV